MSITEFADIINKDLRVLRYANQDERWSACFDHCEVKGKSVLIGVSGEGKTANDAILDYVKQIKGKTLVFGACTDKRQEFVYPK